MYYLILYVFIAISIGLYVIERNKRVSVESKFQEYLDSNRYSMNDIIMAFKHAIHIDNSRNAYFNPIEELGGSACQILREMELVSGEYRVYINNFVNSEEFMKDDELIKILNDKINFYHELELYASKEDFIDDIVERINKKQLKSDNKNG